MPWLQTPFWLHRWPRGFAGFAGFCAQVYFDAAQEFAKLHGLFFAEARVWAGQVAQGSGSRSGTRHYVARGGSPFRFVFYTCASLGLRPVSYRTVLNVLAGQRSHYPQRRIHFRAIAPGRQQERLGIGVKGPKFGYLPLFKVQAYITRFPKLFGFFDDTWACLEHVLLGFERRTKTLTMESKMPATVSLQSNLWREF